jgi:ADP-ribose pyrophosphatase YjhB (NUDIX family)
MNVDDSLNWAMRLQAIAQNGLTFAKDEYDIERYKQIEEIAVQMISNQSALGQEKIGSIFLFDKGYATPKVDVRGAVFSENKILLVKEKSDGCWTLPGGWADVGESPAENVEKEIREESGFIARARKLAMVHDRLKHPHPPLAYHIYKLFFICDLIGGEASSSHETEGAAFFEQEGLPELSIRRVVKSQIDRLFQHFREPDLPTDFD